MDHKALDDRKALEDRNDALYNFLVPSSGACESVEGEHLRAINKIIYRWNNDGDYFYEGYGVETAGPAHAYLYKSRKVDLCHVLDVAVGLRENRYEACLYEALEMVLDWIESHSELEPNTVDMLDSEPMFEEEEEDPWSDDEDDDDEW